MFMVSPKGYGHSQCLWSFPNVNGDSPIYMVIPQCVWPFPIYENSLVYMNDMILDCLHFPEAIRTSSCLKKLLMLFELESIWTPL